MEPSVVLVLVSVGGYPCHPKLGYATWDGAGVGGEGMERGETVREDGEKGEGVVEKEDGEECVREGRKGCAEEGCEEGRGEEKESTVCEGVDGLPAVEDEMADLEENVR